MKTTPLSKTLRRVPSRPGLGAAALVAALLAMAGCSSPVKLDQNAAAAPVETRNVTPAERLAALPRGHVRSAWRRRLQPVRLQRRAICGVKVPAGPGPSGP